jgi:hypothetical protein
MIRLIDLPAVVIAVVLGILLVWLGGTLGITGPMLTRFARSVPSWFGLALFLLICAFLVTASIWIWRKVLAKLGAN